MEELLILNEKCKIPDSYVYRDNFGTHENFINMPNPEELRSGMLRIKHVLANADKYIGKTGVVGGWARTTRTADGKTVLFVSLNDGSC